MSKRTQFLDFTGLSEYDDKIKDYIGDKQLKADNTTTFITDGVISSKTTSMTVEESTETLVIS